MRRSDIGGGLGGRIEAAVGAQRANSRPYAAAAVPFGWTSAV
jgi:hypothetical protein